MLLLQDFAEPRRVPLRSLQHLHERMRHKLPHRPLSEKRTADRDPLSPNLVDERDRTLVPRLGIKKKRR